MIFNEEDLKEVVYIHKVDRGFKTGNFLILYEDFIMSNIELYSTPKTEKIQENIDGYRYKTYNIHSSNVVIPKGIVLRVDNIKENTLRSKYNDDDNEVVLTPLKKYNKLIDASVCDIISQKFKVRVSVLHGMKFYSVSNIDAFLRKRKIDLLIGGK